MLMVLVNLNHYANFNKMKKQNRGGARAGAGPKGKYIEKTTTFSCRVPESKKCELKEIVQKNLEKWKIKK